MKSTYMYLISSRDGAKRLEWIVGHNHNVLYSIDDFISGVGTVAAVAAMVATLFWP